MAPVGFGSLASSQSQPRRSTWVPLGDYVASNTDECTATLMYAVNLKQSGTVSFEYIYPDSSIVFEFFVQNDQCQATVEESRWMRTTEKGWEFHSVELSRGNNVLFWRTTAFSVWSKAPKPVLRRSLCFNDCTAALPLRGRLLRYEFPALAAAAALATGPAFTPRGRRYRHHFRVSLCGPQVRCLSCPAGTEPVLGLEYKWWNVLPPSMETTVLSGINFEYKGIAGWEVAGDFIYTAAGASDNDFMILTLVVPGFR
ncbi:hypothetical protein AAES_147980 [Amazona aestiva]|uniref:Uncharacterized protein n=1 Tax=Amazona aestiva TaxID=12930 RepID=A0A0Q3LX69_AMAAE|nr:hypothetical protein AAES_147980 [Amazona aestiva]